MDDGTRITPEVEEYLRAARGREVARASELLKAKPELLNSIECGGFGALHFAAFNGDTPMLRMLLERKPHVDLENLDDNTPLVMAVKGRQLEAIRILVGAGANINKQSPTGSTAIHHAAAMGFLDCVQLLADLGSKIIFPPCESGSLVHWACHSGDVNVIGAILYVYKVPVDSVDTHAGTALLTALFMKKTEAVEFLLEHGANPDATVTADGTTALHIAVEHGDTECVRLLCGFGADSSTANKEGETPVAAAERLKKEIVIKELRKQQTPKEKRVEESNRFKEQGNKVFGQGENVKAAKFYSLCIRLDNKNQVYFSNRSACYFNQRNYIAAYWDACRCVALAPAWFRGYLRKSATELALKKFDDAIATAATGLKLDSANKDLQSIKDDATRQRR